MEANNITGTSGISVGSFYRRLPITNNDKSIAEQFSDAGSELEDSEDDYLPENSPDENGFISDTDLSDRDEELLDNNFLNPVNRRLLTAVRCRGRGRARGRGRGRAGGRRGRQGNYTDFPRFCRPTPRDDALGWRKNEREIILPVFTSIPAVNDKINEASSPFDVFSLFITSEIINNIKLETNQYARTRVEKEINKNGQLQPRTLLSNWKGVTVSEMYLFFSIILHMSLVKKPTLKHYWSTSFLYATKFCKHVRMSRDRFLAIFSMLHINNNITYKPPGHPEYYALHKIRPFHDCLLKTFLDMYTPKQKLTIDEGMCPFRGRIHFRVYIKEKPHKYGIKLNMICEAESGYCSKFEVYTGPTNQPQNFNSVTNLVHRLVEPFKNKGSTIYMDRYFTSPTLFDELWNIKTTAVGTVMKSRVGMPKEGFDEELFVGEQMFRYRQHLLAIKWKDKRDVYILSTIHKPEMLPAYVVARQEEKLKPAAILSYNKSKVGVDRSDQLLSYNAFRRKTIKWWKKLFFHFFDLAIINSQILFNKTHAKKLPLLNYYEEICNGLILKAGLDLAETENLDVVHVLATRLLGRDHFPARIPATPKRPEGYVQRRCLVCSEKGKYQTGKSRRVDTTFMCSSCQVPLCIIPCFKDFHMKTKYWL